MVCLVQRPAVMARSAWRTAEAERPAQAVVERLVLRLAVP